MRKLLLLLFLIPLGQLLAGVYTLNTIPNPKVIDSRSYVSNPDKILQESTVAELNILLDSLEKTTRTEVAVVVVESIGDEVIETFATSLFKNWGIGKAKEDNGLLVLFVLDQRALRFETGYGVEGLLPDALGYEIQRDFMFPAFKNGDYDRGFLLGMKKIVSVLRQENFAADNEPFIRWSEVLPYVGIIYLLLFVIAILLMSSAVRKVRNNTALKTNIARYKALQAEKNGILIIMNILFPAIALVIIVLTANPALIVFLIAVPVITYPSALYAKMVMRQMRRQPIPCTECNGSMHILSERKEDAYLKISQQFEEQLNAVDYDVFVCKDCGNEAVFTLDKPSIYTECPKCKTKAFILHDKRVIVAPSFINSGTERTTYKCKFCGYEDHHNTNLPRLSRTAGSFAAGTAAGSIFSGRGGFGGSGFGGGSFGGGLSGGGGVTGRW
jgi:uncharacterized protein